MPKYQDKSTAEKLNSVRKLTALVEAGEISREDAISALEERGEDVPGLLHTAVDFGIQGLTLGFSDELEGLVREEGADAPRLRQAISALTNPTTATVSEVGGGIAGALVPGGLAAKGAGLAVKGAGLGARVARGVAGAGAVGGVAGAGAGETPEERLTGAATGAATGAVLGAAFPVAGAGARGVGRGVKKLGEAVIGPARTKDLTTNLVLRALGATTGSTKDLSPAQVKDLADFAVEKGIFGALRTAGGAARKAQAVVDDISQRLREVRGRIRDTASVPVSRVKKKATETFGIASSDLKRPVRAPERNAIRGLHNLIDEAAEGSTTFNHANFMKLNSLIKEKISPLKQQKIVTTDPSLVPLDKARHSFVKNLEREIAEKGLNKADLDNLLTLKHEFSLGERLLERIGRPALQREAGQSLLEASQQTSSPILAGVTGGFLGGAPGVVVGAAGAQAVRSLGPSLQAATARSLESIIKAAPRYRPVLEAAAQRGPQALTATVYLLAQRDADFRQLLAEDDEAKGVAVDAESG